MRDSSGSLLGSWKWDNARLTAGGFVLGISISTDGQTKVVNTDVYNSWVKGPTDAEWRQCFTPTSLPSGEKPLDAGYTSKGGAPKTFAIAVAPSDHNRLYADFLSRLWKSTDCGLTWTKISELGTVVLDPNTGPQPHNPGHHLVVDPNNPDVFLMGTPAGGPFYSTDGGVTVSNITSLPANYVGTGVIPNDTGFQYANKVACDPTSTQVGGIRQTWYVVVQGIGIYKSTSGPGGPYAQMTMAGTTTAVFTDIRVDAAGNVWACEYTGAEGGPVWKCTAGTWAISTSTQNLAVAINPNNVNYVYAANADGWLTWSIDGGANWHAQLSGGATRGAYSNTIPWLGLGNSRMFDPGTFAFDPSQTNKLYSTAGIGIFWCNPPQSIATAPSNGFWFSWFEESEGQEELVAEWAVVPPTGKIVLACADRPLWRPTTLGKVPKGPFYGGSNPNNTLTACWCVDYAADDPNYLAALVSFQGYFHGYSTDGGDSWTGFAGSPGLTALGGCCAVGNKNNIIFVPSQNAAPVYTKDGGATWASLPIGIASPALGWGFSQWNNQKIIAHDKVGAFYLYNSQSGQAGVYKSTDQGDSWTHVYASSITTFDGVHARLHCVPGHPTDLFFSVGLSTGNEPKLMRSTDSAVSWQQVGSLTSVQAIGFGMAKPGQSYPAIYVYGKNNLVPGLWASFDNAVTWTNLATYPNNSLDLVAVVCGDPTVFGRVIVGFQGSGFCFAEYDYALVASAT